MILARGGLGLRSASPNRPAHARPNVAARFAGRLAGWRPGLRRAHARLSQPSPARLGTKQTGPLSRKLHQAALASHRQGLVPASPDFAQVRAAGPPRQAFPCSPHSPSDLSPLLAALLYTCPALRNILCLRLCLPSAFCQRCPRCCGAKSSFRFRDQFLILCMYAHRRCKVTTPPRSSNNTLHTQMPVCTLLCPPT